MVPAATKENPMTVPAFHSINEADKPAPTRVYHNNVLCRPGHDIQADERRNGTGGYRLCDDCKRLNDQGR